VWRPAHLAQSSGGKIQLRYSWIAVVDIFGNNGELYMPMGIVVTRTTIHWKFPQSGTAKLTRSTFINYKQLGNR